MHPDVSLDKDGVCPKCETTCRKEKPITRKVGR
jgi:hypothetical protein